MAKTKKEETVDLSQPKKVNDDQLKKIQSIVDRINKLQMNIGQLETQKHQMLHSVAGVSDEMNLMQQELQSQYGTNDINIMDGTINYPKENGEADKKD